jgi:lysyl-tRNA synthetase class II
MSNELVPKQISLAEYIYTSKDNRYLSSEVNLSVTELVALRSKMIDELRVFLDKHY